MVGACSRYDVDMLHSPLHALARTGNEFTPLIDQEASC